MIKKYLLLALLPVAIASCALLKKNGGDKNNPLRTILRDPALKAVVDRKDAYEIQIILTQIDRDEEQVPHFTTWHFNVDSNRYFYPASVVKMPLAALALEKISTLRASGYPRIHSETPYQLDSVRAFQQRYVTEPAAPEGLPTIAQDVRAIFAVSDNDAYNHLFDFLGREYINKTLYQKGYEHTAIMHRFYAARRDQSLAQPFRFVDKGGRVWWQEKEKVDRLEYVNPCSGLLKGKGYKNAQDSLIRQPFDFTSKNRFALTDMERMLRALLFPATIPASNRFHISDADYTMLHRAMGLFPREFKHPKYNEQSYWDGYVKFFVMGDTKNRQDGSIRIFNKVGEAYGTLTDVAYVVDEKNGVEFVLAATILCNTDGIFNDDAYDYDTVGFPFLAQLGQKVLEYERKRPKTVRADLEYWRRVVE
jgi:hypothetical protein